MRRVIGSALVAAGLALAPVVATAQHSMAMPSHEFGADLSFAYFKASGATGLFGITTPVDLRVGFVTSSGMTIEPRIGLMFLTGGGASTHNINLDLNALFPLGGTYRKGPYFTVGAGADFIGATGTPSATLVEFNGGIGTRVPYESGAFRLEAYGKYHLKNTTLLSPNILEIGARVGLSLWH